MVISAVYTQCIILFKKMSYLDLLYIYVQKSLLQVYYLFITEQNHSDNALVAFLHFPLFKTDLKWDWICFAHLDFMYNVKAEEKKKNYKSFCIICMQMDSTS